MPDKFQPDDRIFAKIKGWPPWPAKVVSRVEGKGESYVILFYGTYDTSTVKPDSMFPYNDDTKAKYGKPKNSYRWKEAMDEIEKNTAIGETGPLEEAPAEVMEVDNDTDGDGELMIDEGPLPPVLTKEAGNSKTQAPSNQNGKTEQPPPKAPARRGSKASLSKRDSISSTSSATEVSTPTATPAIPGTEMVSRSGRKIKPKRFADDEISTPTPTKNKASSQDEGSEGPPSKRAKRGGKTPPAAKSTPVAESKEPATRPRMIIGKGKGTPAAAAPPPRVAPASGRFSPDINAPVPKAPALKPAVIAPQRKSDASAPQVSKKPLPALIPAAGSAVALQQQQTQAPVRRAPSLRQQARQEVVTDEESEGESPPILAMGVDEAEADDKENQKEGAPSSNGSEEMESESEMEKNSEIDEAYSEANDETLMKLRFGDKDGEPFEIRLEQKETFESEEEQKDYDNTLQTVAKLKEDLEQGDQDVSYPSEIFMTIKRLDAYTLNIKKSH